MIPDPEYNIWEHSQNVRDLYTRRARGQEEMDASAQGAELLAPFIRAAGKTLRLLDAGCGSGYFWHSLARRNLTAEYFGLDYSPSLIEIGRTALADFGVPAENLICGRIEDLLNQTYDLVTLINTLTFCPDFRAPLDRLARTGARVILIRDNFGEQTRLRWEPDGYLDPGYNHLKAYWNQWSFKEVGGFLSGLGYAAQPAVDRRTGGRLELVVDKPYFWSWLLAEKLRTS